MFAYRKHGDGTHTKGAKIPKSKLNSSSIVGEDDFGDNEANIMIKDKVHATKSSGKAHMGNLISKLYKKQARKQKISPLASQLLRTISIHHLECNDYVPDEVTSGSETSTGERYSLESDSSADNQHEPLLHMGPNGSVFGQCCNTENAAPKAPGELGDHSPEKQSVLREELDKANEYFSKLKDTNVEEQDRDVLLAVGLFNVNREFFRIDLHNSASILVNYVQDRENSSPGIILTKSRSYPGAGLPGRRNGGLFELKWKGDGTFIYLEPKAQVENSPSTPNTTKDDSQSQASISDVKVDILKQKPRSWDGAEISSIEFSPGFPLKPEKKKSHGTVLNRFKVLKQKIKGAFRANKEEHHRVSMDGLLHKIPYGEKVPEDVDKDNLQLWGGSASDRYDKDIPRCKANGDGPVSDNSKYKHSTIQRSRSLAESLDKYSRLFESISHGESRRPPERLESIREQDRMPQNTWGRIFSNPEFGRYAFTQAVPRELSHALVSSKIPDSSLLRLDTVAQTYISAEPKFTSTLLRIEETMNSDIGVEHTAIEDGVRMLASRSEQSEICKVSVDITKNDSFYVPLHGSEATTEMDSPDKTTRPSPISILDSHFQEYPPISPVKDSVTEGPELKPRMIIFQELDSVANDATNGMEVIQEDFHKVQMPKDRTDFNSPNVRLDQNDGTKFNYVREILKKSRFYGEDVLKEWYSPQQPLDPSLFAEANLSLNERSIGKDESGDMSIDFQLLFDLINDVLLDIYGSSFFHGLGFPLFCSRNQPKPVGNHLLEEVWAKICWHLSAETQLDPTFDYVVARDFSKYDGWMNLQHDAECIGMELENLILDDLLDEFILEFDNFATRYAATYLNYQLYDHAPILPSYFSM